MVGTVREILVIHFEVLVWISNLTPHFIIGVICYLCWELSSFLLVNEVPWGFEIGIIWVRQ